LRSLPISVDAESTNRSSARPSSGKPLAARASAMLAARSASGTLTSSPYSRWACASNTGIRVRSLETCARVMRCPRQPERSLRGARALIFHRIPVEPLALSHGLPPEIRGKGGSDGADCQKGGADGHRVSFAWSAHEASESGTGGFRGRRLAERRGKPDMIGIRQRPTGMRGLQLEYCIAHNRKDDKSSRHIAEESEDRLAPSAPGELTTRAPVRRIPAPSDPLGAP
jgi:hypothetical protein